MAVITNIYIFYSFRKQTLNVSLKEEELTIYGSSLNEQLSRT